MCMGFLGFYGLESLEAGEKDGGREMEEKKKMEDRVLGFVLGAIVTVIVELAVVTAVGKSKHEDASEMLVIEYMDCREEKKDGSNVANDMVQMSGVWTNFVDRDVVVEKHRTRWVFSNPGKKTRGK